MRIAIARKNKSSDLWFSNLGLHSLPPEVMQLTNLKQIYLRGNPDLRLPTELILAHEMEECSAQAILDYYFSVQEHGEKPLNEIKMLFLGRGDVGKNSREIVAPLARLLDGGIKRGAIVSPVVRLLPRTAFREGGAE